MALSALGKFYYQSLESNSKKKAQREMLFSLRAFVLSGRA